MTDLSRLCELAEKATSGPWTSEFGGLYDGPWVGAIGSTPTSRVFVAETANHPDGLDDAGYIAAVSPDVLLPLLDRLERAETALRAARYCIQIGGDSTVKRLAREAMGEDFAPRRGRRAVRSTPDAT